MQDENKQLVNKETWVLLFNHTPKGGDTNDGTASIDAQKHLKKRFHNTHFCTFSQQHVCECCLNG